MTLSNIVQAETFAYEGTIKLLDLTGKDCVDVKVGDSFPVRVGVEVQARIINGYLQIEGYEVAQLVGDNAASLKYSYIEADLLPGVLGLQALASDNIGGYLHEPLLKSSEAGCNFTHAQIVARQSSRGQDAQASMGKMANDFAIGRVEYDAKNATRWPMRKFSASLQKLFKLKQLAAKICHLQRVCENICNPCMKKRMAWTLYMSWGI